MSFDIEGNYNNTMTNFCSPASKDSSNVGRSQNFCLLFLLTLPSHVQVFATGVLPLNLQTHLFLGISTHEFVGTGETLTGLFTGD